uniref:Saposin B-type domain-containing protein n=1 Tax=Panagrellus redivivus TaxID=6233 RepID=A0A7E4W045_PANRE
MKATAAVYFLASAAVLIQFVDRIAAAPPICITCYDMMDDIRDRFHDDFSKVTVTDLQNALISECSKKETGVSLQLCKQTVTANAPKLLDSLKKKSNDAQACRAVTLCNG